MFSSTVRRVAVAALAMPALLVAAAATASADVPGQSGSEYDFDMAAAGAMTGGISTSGAVAVSTHSSATDDTGSWWGWRPSAEHDSDVAIAGTANFGGPVPLAHEYGPVHQWSAPQVVDSTPDAPAVTAPAATKSQPKSETTVSHRPSHHNNCGCHHHQVRPVHHHHHHQQCTHHSQSTGAHYDHTAAAAGPDGASVDSTESDAYTGHHGDYWSSDYTVARYHHVTASAGMDGADVDETHSVAVDSGEHGHTWAAYEHTAAHAGSDGAWIDSTDSGASS